MLDLAGAEADGTVLWMAGRNVIADHSVPRIREAADSAGRSDPRIVGLLPVCVTADEAAARDRAGRAFPVYDTLPSYKATLDMEGAAGPADVAIVGDKGSVRRQIEALAAIGVTDFVAAEFGASHERAETRALLRDLAASSSWPRRTSVADRHRRDPAGLATKLGLAGRGREHGEV